MTPLGVLGARPLGSLHVAPDPFLCAGALSLGDTGLSEFAGRPQVMTLVGKALLTADLSLVGTNAALLSGEALLTVDLTALASGSTALLTGEGAVNPELTQIAGSAALLTGEADTTANLTELTDGSAALLTGEGSIAGDLTQIAGSTSVVTGAAAVSADLTVLDGGATVTATGESAVSADLTSPENLTALLTGQAVVSVTAVAPPVENSWFPARLNVLGAGDMPCEYLLALGDIPLGEFWTSEFAVSGPQVHATATAELSANLSLVQNVAAVLTGEAETTASFGSIVFGSAVVTGDSQLSARLFLQGGSLGEVSGQAQTFADLTVLQNLAATGTGDATVLADLNDQEPRTTAEGTASVNASFTQAHLAAVAASGEAAVFSRITKQVPAAATVTGRCDMFAFGRSRKILSLQPGTFPYTEGATGPYTANPDPNAPPKPPQEPTLTSLLELRVDSQAINIGESTVFTIGDFTFGYDAGKTLTISEILAQTSYGEPSFSLDEAVELQRGDNVIFRGRISQITHVGETHNEAAEYTVAGTQQLSNLVEVYDSTTKRTTFSVEPIEIPRNFVAGDESVEGSVVVFPTLGEAIDGFFTLMGPRLITEGLSADYSTEGLSLDVQIRDSLQLSGGFFNSLAQLAAFDPGVKVWFNDIENRWEFHRPHLSTEVEVNIADVDLDSHSLTRSLEDRFTAVRLLHRSEVSLDRESEITELYPLWDTNYQQTWAYNFAGSPTRDSLVGGVVLENPYWPVYRRWAIPGNLEKLRRSTDIRLFHRTSDQLNARYAEVEARVTLPETVTADEESEGGGVPYATVVANQPIVVAGNPFAPGDAIGPTTAVKLVMTESQTLVLSGELRFPAEGYSGSAYTEHGIEREKVIEVDASELTTSNAYHVLKTLSDVLVSGDLPIDGAPLDEFLNLNRAVLLHYEPDNPTPAEIASPPLTGVENSPAPVSRVTYTFGRPGRMTLSLNNDLRSIIRQQV